jgi:hypothetical protein
VWAETLSVISALNIAAIPQSSKEKETMRFIELPNSELET